MSLTFETLPTLPPETGEQVADRVLSAYHGALPAQPEDAIPTLVGGPDAFDADTASRVVVQASRWLEFLAGQACEVEARRVTLAGEVEWLESTLKFKHGGKVEKAPEQEFARLRAARYALVELQAREAVLAGLRGSLTKVKEAASRRITALVKTTPVLGD